MNSVPLLLVLAVPVLAEPPLATQPMPPKSEAVLQAEEAFQKGHYDEALTKLREAVRKDPSLPPARLTLADLFLKAKQGPNARLNLERALAEAPDDPRCYLHNASIALAEGRITDTILNLQFVLQLAKAERWSAEQRKGFQREARAGLDLALERRSDWSAARGQLAAWLETDPTNTVARGRLARVLFRLGKIDEAFAELQTAARNNPTTDPAELGMARLYVGRNDRKAGDDKQAEEWFQKALQKHPQSARVHQAYADWLLTEDRLDAARPHIETANQLDPKSRNTRLLRGLLARREKKYVEAEKIFEELLRESPADAVAADQLALVLIEQTVPAQQQRAVQLAEVNARQNPHNAEALATLGWVYFRTGKVDEADHVLGQLSGAALNSDTAYYVAQLLKQKGKLAEARTLLEQALKAPGTFVYRAEARKLLAELPKAPTGSGAATPKPPR